MRESHFVADNQDFTCTELTFMIDLLCTSLYHCYIVVMLVVARYKNQH